MLQKFNIDEILVTMGKQGGYIISIDGHKTIYQAYPVKPGTDTTGAGDIFMPYIWLSAITLDGMLKMP